MKNSMIFELVKNSASKLNDYYEYSFLNRVQKKSAVVIKKWAAGSSILGFFDKDWKVEQKWTNSMSYKLMTLPVRLIGAISAKTAKPLSKSMEQSMILGSIAREFNRLFQYSTRVYGLGLLAFAVTYGALKIVKNGTVGVPAPAELAVMIAAAALILMDRPVKALFEGSFIMRLAADFFTAGGKDNDR